MSNQQSICNICGANYEYRNGRWACPACGAYKPEEITNEETTLLFSADQKLRLSEFDDAEWEFDDIVRKYPNNHAGYWGRLRARYGIKYEEDFDGRRIPTCCATSIESFLSDSDYKKAIELADRKTAEYYREQAEYIERVRREWVEKARKEKPYDVFICYKDSDLANGVQRTRDSIAAQELYIHLQNQGYRVFYSRETLRNKVGEKYEPYIFNALSTAKVMVVYGSSAEYIQSTWVKNEWIRFSKKIAAGEKKGNSLVVAYAGFDPKFLPKPLSSMQCMDATKPSFYSDLEKHIDKIIHGERKKYKATRAPESEVKKRSTKKIMPIALVSLLLAAAIVLGVFLGVKNANDGLPTPDTEPIVSDVQTKLPETELVSKLKGDDFDITITSAGDKLSANAKVLVKELDGSHEASAVASEELKKKGPEYVLYDITLSEFDEGTVVNVSLPLPEEMKGSDISVYYVNPNAGTATRLDSSVKGDYVTFLTNHFSPYAILERWNGGYEYYDGVIYGYEGNETKLVIPDSIKEGEEVKVIAENAFESNDGLESVVLPQKLEKVLDGAFSSCKNLKNITIPSSVKEIAPNSFKECTALVAVFYEGSESDWSALEIGADNKELGKTKKYYYNENKPDSAGDRWHYVDGVPTVWEPEEMPGDSSGGGTSSGGSVSGGGSSSGGGSVSGGGSSSGGSVSGGGTATHTHNYDTTWSMDATSHWKECTDSTCDFKISGNHTSTNSCTVCEYTAVNTTKLSTVSFITYGGNKIDPITAKSGTTIELPIPVREGYTFSTWSPYINAKTYTVTDSDITFDAYWAEETQLFKAWFDDGESYDNEKEGLLYAPANSINGHVIHVPKYYNDDVLVTELLIRNFGYGSYYGEIEGVVYPDGMTNLAFTRSTYDGFHKADVVSILLPKSIEAISSYALKGLELDYILFEGTSQQWESMKKGTDWEPDTEYTVLCLEDENCIATKGLKYTLIEDSYYSVTGYEGTNSLVCIPRYYNGLPVIYIGDNAFEGCETIKTVFITGKVTTIGNSAFKNCTNLQKVSVYHKVALKTVSDYAFYGCKSLSTFFAFDTITSIGNYAFYDCKSLDITPEHPSYNFLYKTVSFNNLISIGEYAFANSSIDSFEFANTVSSVGKGAFMNCTLLTNVTNNAKQWSEIPESLFEGCINLKQFTFQYSIQKIGNYAFKNTALTYVNLHPSIYSMGTGVFDGCKDIAVYCAPNEKPDEWNNDWCGDNVAVFWNCDMPVYGDVFQEIGGSYGVSKAIHTIPSRYRGLPVATILESAYQDCSSTSSVFIPSSIKKIESYAFWNATRLKTINFEGTEEEWDAIEKGSNWDLGLGSYYDGYTVNYLGTSTSTCDFEMVLFEGNGLDRGYRIVKYLGNEKNVVIPSEYYDIPIREISNSAFEGTDIESITIPIELKYIGKDAFKNCENLTEVIFVIPEYAYNWTCTSIVAQEIEYSVIDQKMLSDSMAMAERLTDETLKEYWYR